MLLIAAERRYLQRATKEVSRGAPGPTLGDLDRLERACRYLAATRGRGGFLVPEKSDGLALAKVYTASDWGGDKVGRKSTSAADVFMNGALARNRSRAQATVAASSAEAEAYSMGSGAREGLP